VKFTAERKKKKKKEKKRKKKKKKEKKRKKKPSPLVLPTKCNFNFITTSFVGKTSGDKVKIELIISININNSFLI
jgi:hypothetical protein